MHLRFVYKEFVYFYTFEDNLNRLKKSMLGFSQAGINKIANLACAPAGGNRENAFFRLFLQVTM